MGAAAAVIIIRRERDIVELYQRAGATTPAMARTPDDLGIGHHVAFNILVRRAVLRDVGDGRYYLDEPSWQAQRSRRHVMAVVLLFVVLAVTVTLISVGVVSVRGGLPSLH
jgi:hypothetical protein